MTTMQCNGFLPVTSTCLAIYSTSPGLLQFAAVSVDPTLGGNDAPPDATFLVKAGNAAGQFTTPCAVVNLSQAEFNDLKKYLNAGQVTQLQITFGAAQFGDDFQPVIGFAFQVNPTLFRVEALESKVAKLEEECGRLKHQRQ